MPIYEYRCPGCGEKFEKLVRFGASEVRCPTCDSDKPVRLVSQFAHSGSQADYGSSFASSSSSACSTST